METRVLQINGEASDHVSAAFVGYPGFIFRRL